MELTAADLEEFRPTLTGRSRCLRYLFDWPPGVEVEDVVSSAIVKAWERRNEFRGDPSCRALLAAWLLRILNSEIVDSLRWNGADKRGAGKTRSFEEFIAESESRIEQFLAADISTVSGRLEKEEMVQAAYAAIELLPERQRTCVLARFIGGWTIEQIALDLNRSPGVHADAVTEKAVMSLIERALRKLRDLLQHLK